MQSQKHGWDELACLVVHYGWYLGLVFSQLPLAKALLFVLLTQMICGFFLSIVFVQSHNGMEVYSTEKDFVTAQVVSTRDIASGIWNDWFTGEQEHAFPNNTTDSVMFSISTVFRRVEASGYEHSQASACSQQSGLHSSPHKHTCLAMVP